MQLITIENRLYRVRTKDVIKYQKQQGMEFNKDIHDTWLEYIEKTYRPIAYIDGLFNY